MTEDNFESEKIVAVKSENKVSNVSASIKLFSGSLKENTIFCIFLTLKT